LWFGWLNELPYPAAWSENIKALAMMALDQTIGATVITIGFFFAFEMVSFALISTTNNPSHG
jgi:hypothetical protein